MLDHWFKLHENRTTAGTEVVAGLTTFMVPYAKNPSTL